VRHPPPPPYCYPYLCPYCTLTPSLPSRCGGLARTLCAEALKSSEQTAAAQDAAAPMGAAAVGGACGGLAAVLLLLAGGAALWRKARMGPAALPGGQAALRPPGSGAAPSGGSLCNIPAMLVLTAP